MRSIYLLFNETLVVELVNIPFEGDVELRLWRTTYASATAFLKILARPSVPDFLKPTTFKTVDHTHMQSIQDEIRESKKSDFPFFLSFFHVRNSI